MSVHTPGARPTRPTTRSTVAGQPGEAGSGAAEAAAAGRGDADGASSRRRFLRAALGGGMLLGGAVLVRHPVHAVLGADGVVRLRDLYQKDLSFSSLASSLEGQRVAVRGFMAPPLKAESSFFVLTKRPMANCPFCNDASDWPDDIVAVYTKRPVRVLPFNVDIVVRGELELGDRRDPDTGFLSRLRLVDAVAERI